MLAFPCLQPCVTTRLKDGAITGQWNIARVSDARPPRELAQAREFAQD